MGTGRFAAPPEGGPEYRRGYLCGMIRGDGHLGSYACTSDRTRTRRGPQVPAGSVGPRGGADEPATYLAGLECPTDEFVFQEAVGQSASNERDPYQRRASAWPRSGSIIAWPCVRVRLNGARGSWLGSSTPKESTAEGCLRICNTDHAIVDQITSCLRRFGFTFAIETRLTGNASSASHVRAIARRASRSTCASSTPSIPRSRASGSIEGTAIKADAPLRVVSIEPLGVDLTLYDITTGTGDFIANGMIRTTASLDPATPT